MNYIRASSKWMKKASSNKLPNKKYLFIIIGSVQSNR